MNANSVMNNADLVSHQILPLLFAPKPSCCDRCQVVGRQLHLFKTPTAKNTFVVPACLYKFLLPDTFCPRLKTGAEYDSLYNIPKEIKTNDELLCQIKASSVFDVKNEWFCDSCWIRKVGCLKNSSVYYAVQKANPNFDDKKIKKEIQKITDNELLFKTHRIKKTQEKAELYEGFVYSYLRENNKSIIRCQKMSAEEHLQVISRNIQRKKERTCEINSRNYVDEIVSRKIAKWYTERKIPYKLFQFINSHQYHRTATWGGIASEYSGYASIQNRNADLLAEKGELALSKQTRYPALPEWWNDL